MLNRIVLVGRLTRDPELKYAPSGTPLVTFGIAVDRRTKSASGDRETDFINIVAFRQTAEFVSQYVGKGRLVAIDGRLQIRSWTATDGTRRTSAEVIAESVQALDRPKEGTPAGVGAAAEGIEEAAGGFDMNEERDPFADE
ncbi:MAG: single-stranded DNA-binding protein [Armatimonadetes bacterium]|nr:single-stranded DNA-binding protein [Armatimonadota bacterium]